MQIADLRFLVAEDNEFQRRWLTVMLTNLGAKHVIEVSNGYTALDALRNKNQAIDISFIDLNMPGMDGMELIRHMSNEEHPSSIILASAMAPSLVFSVQTMSKAYGVNLLGAIEKPATPETLLALINLHQPQQAAPLLRAADLHFTIDEITEGLRKGEFEPLFQPKVEFATGHVKGAEAFARWRHPQHGMVPPAVFMPVLEAHGETEALAWAVIEQSVAACRKWNAQGFAIPVSINLAPSCLMQPDLAERIIDYIAKQGVPPEHIAFEITESAVQTVAPPFLENLVRLRMKGFGLTVDDYGTGHSSMQELLRIPFSELKIDRSFVVGASQNQSLEAILDVSLELCRKLDRQSVAVGVETRQDWDLLLNLGCICAQGYYIAKPMEGDALPAWMKEWAEFF
jgi:EAL domain-containing protein (putative c-di-GMP-specific phosphodiesterase class I)/ActR/RegA family two-component response regulator